MGDGIWAAGLPVGGGIGGGINNFRGTLILNGDNDITKNRAEGNGDGGGVYNAGTITVGSGRTSIFANVPDNCVNASGGTGCPA